MTQAEGHVDVSPAEAGRARADGEVTGGDPPGRAPWLRFALIFGVLAMSSELAYYGVVLESELFRAYLRVLAAICTWIMELFGADVSLRGAQISGLGFAVEVAHGCDALQVCALLTAAVIAFPAPLSHKLRGIVVGIVVLQALNLARIVSLFLIGAKFVDFFETTHEVVWPLVLIVATIAIWVLWVRFETREEVESPVGGA